MEYWFSSIANRWLVAERATGRIVGQYIKRKDVMAVYPDAIPCCEMAE